MEGFCPLEMECGDGSRAKKLLIRTPQEDAPVLCKRERTGERIAAQGGQEPTAKTVIRIAS
jgi:hypothetical protein